MVACCSVAVHPIRKIEPLLIGLNPPQQVEAPCWLLAILFQRVVGGASEGGVATWPRPLRLFTRTASVNRAHQLTAPFPGKRSCFTHRSVCIRSLPFLGDLQETGGFSMKDEADA